MEKLLCIFSDLQDLVLVFMAAAIVIMVIELIRANRKR